MEQKLTREHGLPGRPWFRHHIYAPGFYTGYGVKTLPGVREAIEQYDWSLASNQISILADVLHEFSASINEAADMAK
jgi:N-acetylated-alpha-linked acidic dipeptidase